MNTTAGKAVVIAASISWAAFLSSPAYGEDNGTTSKPACTCYLPKDCTSSQFCDVGLEKCTAAIVGGKAGDGLCKANETPPKSPTSQAEIVEALDLYFEAYLVPIRDGVGPPNETLIAAAQSILLGAQDRQVHARLQNAVHLLLDATIGFDFQTPQPNGCGTTGAGEGSFAPGFIRMADSAAGEIVDAARDGMIIGISEGNFNEAIRPLQEFWSRYPDYHPFHTGRFYSHGHAEYEESVGTPLQGQIDVLRRVLSGFRDLRYTEPPD